MIRTHLPTVVSVRLLAILTLVLVGLNVQAQMPDSSFWVPNGEVDALVLHDSTVIIGGDFDQVTPVTGALARLDTATAAYDPSLFKVNGVIYAMCRDNRGYVYVGGSFTRAGNQTVENLFRIKPDGHFDNSWVCAIDGPVYSLCYYNTDLYVGGSFGLINGDIRHNIGSVNLDSGGVNIFDPDVNGPVYCMAPDTVFGYMVIGGDFTQVGVFSPPYIAKVGFLSGAPQTFNAVPWTANPNCNGPVHALSIANGCVYLGGEFTQFGSQFVRGLAQILVINGYVQWNVPNINGSVYAIQNIGSQLYIGGSFSSVGMQSRANLACVDFSLAVQPWNPGANGEVRVITVLDSARFFVGGDFSMAGGDTCGRGALINYLDNGTVSNWNPSINNMVYAAAVDTFNRLYVGGAFFGLGGVVRNNLCALNINTGIVTSWDPNVSAAVRAMTLDGDTLYFAGDFGSVSATTRSRIAAIDLNTSTLLSFNPSVNGLVRTIAVTDTAVYFGGNFTNLGGQPRMNIGQVNKSNALVTTWNPGCLGTVNKILPTTSWIYVAGFYSTIAGVTRQNLSRLDPYSGAADWNWICDTDDGIYHAEFYGNQMVIGGWFSTVNGQASPDFAFIDTATISVTAPNFNCDGFVRTFTSFGDDFFVSGTFNLVNASFQERLVAYDQGDNNIDPWAPFPSTAPVTMKATADKIFLGGSMTAIGGIFHPYLQVVNVQWVTSVPDVAPIQSSFSLYPNPAVDEITVESENMNSFMITDAMGRIVQTGRIQNGRTIIEVGSLASGLYHMTLCGEHGEISSQAFIRN